MPRQLFLIAIIKGLANIKNEQELCDTEMNKVIITIYIMLALKTVNFLSPAMTSVNGNSEELGLELPIVGAAGWAGARLRLTDKSTHDLIMYLEPGQAFVILEQSDERWRVRLPCGTVGWVLHEACFINLPDVIPSIVLNATNSSGSLFLSGGYDIPNITGHQLYPARSLNPRFGYEMYIMPVLYSTSLKLFEVQQAALYDGRTLVIYEIFRPRETQRRVVAGLQNLMNTNATVRNGINTYPWNAAWFIAHGISVHQRAAAIDASLAQVVLYEIRTTPGSGFSYRRITDMAYYEMPTSMHDLHPNAASLIHPRGTTLAPTMTEGSIALRNYFLNAGFTPIASEWWHFTDRLGNQTAQSHGITGDFYIRELYSFPPPNGVNIIN